MSETKEQVAAERDSLRTEVEQLRGELAAARAGAASPARVTLAAPAPLSEGDRQALEIAGVISSGIDGKRMFADDYGIEVKTPDGRDRLARERAKGDAAVQGIEGVTHVYPSVAPGVLADDAPVRGAQPASAVQSEVDYDPALHGE